MLTTFSDLSIIAIPMPLNTVYYFPTNERGEEGQAIAVSLNDQGQADLSGLPEDIRGHLETFGVQDALKTETLFAKDGQLFLEALLYATNQGWRFRLAP
jgi:hypothetical protein